jgi:hypothetical protein
MACPDDHSVFVGEALITFVVDEEHLSPVSTCGPQIVASQFQDQLEDKCVKFCTVDGRLSCSGKLGCDPA